MINDFSMLACMAMALTQVCMFAVVSEGTPLHNVVFILIIGQYVYTAVYMVQDTLIYTEAHLGIDFD